MATIQEVRSKITNDDNVGKIRRGTDAPVNQRRLLPSADGAITQLSALRCVRSCIVPLKLYRRQRCPLTFEWY
jgi:hypothetical protein